MMLLGILNWLRGLRPSSIRAQRRKAHGRATVKTSDLLSLPECLLTEGKLKGTYLSSDPCERAAAYHLGYRAVYQHPDEISVLGSDGPWSLTSTTSCSTTERSLSRRLAQPRAAVSWWASTPIR